MNKCMLLLLLAGCIPASIVSTTVREERKVSREAQDLLSGASDSVAQVTSEVARVTSEAVFTLHVARETISEVEVFFSVAIVVLLLLVGGKKL